MVGICWFKDVGVPDHILSKLWFKVEHIVSATLRLGWGYFEVMLELVVSKGWNKPDEILSRFCKYSEEILNFSTCANADFVLSLF